MGQLQLYFPDFDGGRKAYELLIDLATEVGARGILQRSWSDGMLITVPDESLFERFKQACRAQRLAFKEGAEIPPDNGGIAGGILTGLGF